MGFKTDSTAKKRNFQNQVLEKYNTKIPEHKTNKTIFFLLNTKFI